MSLFFFSGQLTRFMSGIKSEFYFQNFNPREREKKERKRTHLLLSIQVAENRLIEPNKYVRGEGEFYLKRKSTYPSRMQMPKFRSTNQVFQ